MPFPAFPVFPAFPAFSALFALLLALTACDRSSESPDVAVPGGANRLSEREAYVQLVDLFLEWREFASPDYVQGVPDYSSGAMGAQHAALPQWRARLDGCRKR